MSLSTEDLMILLSAFIGLLIVEAGYIKLAKRFKIVDKPNERSSHTQLTALGGGVLFPIAFLIGAILSGQLLIGVLGAVMALVGWIDDRVQLSVKIRLPIQLACVGVMLFWIIPDLDWYWYPVFLVFITGWVNTFNFMDGINGISLSYGLVFIAALLANQYLQEGSLQLDLENASGPWVLVILSLLAFAFFNFRKKALCFAGDVGSVSLAFIIASLFIIQWRGADTIYLLGLPAVYAVDSVFTIVRRLYLKQNIFQAHRSHLYQYLSNEMGWDHRVTSISYSILQAVVSLIAILVIRNYSSLTQLFAVITVYLILGLIYLLSIKKIKRDLQA